MGRQSRRRLRDGLRTDLQGRRHQAVREELGSSPACTRSIDQAETDSNIWILDAYGHFGFNGLLLEGEILNISGEKSAIKLAGGDGENPLYKEVDIWGYVARAGYEQSDYSLIFETGYASGDDDVNDDRFTGRSLHSDYNVGLLLYEEVLSRVSAAAFPGDASSLASKGGVYNSRYIYPHIKFRPTENLELIAAYLMAWPDKADGAVIQCERETARRSATPSMRRTAAWAGRLIRGEAPSTST